jgi:peroxiredoxin
MALTQGEPLIDFSLPATDGQPHTPTDYTDKKVLVIVFTCNHCPYALAWEPRLIDIQAHYADKGVQLIGINANDAQKYPADSFEKMQQHVTENQWNFPYLHDETQAIATAYGAQRTPEVFVFNDKRTLQYHGTIDDNYEAPEDVQQTYLRDALDAILAGNTPPVTHTDPVGCTIKWK